MCAHTCACICKTTITEIEGMNLRGQVGHIVRVTGRKGKRGKLDREVDCC